MLRMQVKPLGKVLDLANVLDCMMLVQAFVRTYFLLGVMAKSLPRVPGRSKYSMITRGPKGCQESAQCLNHLAEAFLPKAPVSSRHVSALCHEHIP